MQGQVQSAVGLSPAGPGPRERPVPCTAVAVFCTFAWVWEKRRWVAVRVSVLQQGCRVACEDATAENKLVFCTRYCTLQTNRASIGHIVGKQIGRAWSHWTFHVTWKMGSMHHTRGNSQPKSLMRFTKQACLLFAIPASQQSTTKPFWT